MGAIIGIPTTRVSDLFVRSRLLQQVQYDQRELYRVQTQLSTGYRYQLPSEDPISALRVMSLQRLLERKEQVKSNLETNQSFLTATDSAASHVSEIVSDARAVALSVMGTTSTDDQRAAAAQQIEQAIQQLLDTGNHKFRDRYLFAGSRTDVRPFERDGDLITYLGNENTLLSYSDTDLLFQTNVTGAEMFGALSDAVRGQADLNPALTMDTRLSDLYGGLGVDLGSIAISDGSTVATIDLSSAETIGDVALLIKNNAERLPLNVEITATGLKIQLDAAVGDLSILEVGEGNSAHQLGIYTPIGVGLNPVVGEDLNPALTLTTSLDDITGTYSRAYVRFPSTDNDFILTADTRGEALNGTKIRFLDDPTVTFGNEVVQYDPAAKEITVLIDEGHTLAQHVVDAINTANAAGTLPFTAELDTLDQGDYAGLGLVAVTPPGEWAATTEGGSGEEFDKTSGLQITNAGQTHTIDISEAETVEDLLNILNSSEAGLLAQINESRTGIDIRSRVSGADFAVGENGGVTATQLGVRTFTGETKLADMNFGRGVFDYQSDGQRASATYTSNGLNNDLLLRARNDGSDWNDYELEIYDSGLPPGSETITYDPVNKKISIGIAPGYTTAKDVVDLFAATPGARDDFELVLADEEGNPLNDGSGLVQLGTTSTSGGSAGGVDFLITRADGVTLEFDISGAQTVQDVIDLINNHPDNPPRAPGEQPWLYARLATYGNGIELVDDSLGSGTLTVERTKLSTTAIDLGFIPPGENEAQATSPGSIATTTVASPGPNSNLIVRSRFPTSDANGYRVIFEDTVPGAESFTFDPVNKELRFEIETGVTDANRIITMFQADLAASQRFEIVLDPADGNDGTGFVAATDPLNPPQLSGGEPTTLTGRDVAPLETESVFNALLRLKHGLLENDSYEMERAVQQLDDQLLNFNFVRADLGAKQNGLDILQTRLEDEDVELRSMLSDEHDIDMVEAISSLTGRQMALEAALQATAKMFQLTLLDYL
ncbi:hypothetical protein JCM19992_04670 [Thermostilla marina]